MTWQRIDDDTYIDDTLVTCAEYQLFIDEMLEQGKFYQPDHWKSHQFSYRQGRQPILGIRYSDAMAFCEWISIHAEKEAKFRLPLHKEGEEFPLMNIKKEIMGYWINDGRQFIWIDAIPENARNLISASNLSRAFSLDLKLENEVKLIQDRARNLPLDILRVQDIFRSLDHSFDSIDSARARDLESAFARILSRNNSAANVINIATSLLRLNIRERYSIDDSMHALNILIELFTLQERIAGRSPAFEGIRLVKERIR